MPSESAIGKDDWADFSARLRAYVGRKVAPAEADDVTGDILIKLVVNTSTLAAAANPMAWIHRVANNAIVDFYRRTGTERRTLAEMAHTANTPDEDATSAAASLSRCMIPFIERLPARYADALMLTEIDGLTQRAAAERLGLTLPALKSRVQRGRRKLKQSVLRCCTIEADHRGRIVDYRPRTSGSGACRPSDSPVD